MNKTRGGVAPFHAQSQSKLLPYDIKAPPSYVRQQPQPPFLMTKSQWEGRTKWSKDLCSCIDPCEEFCYCCWCYPCFTCQLAWRMNESCWSAFCIPGYLAILRTKIRTQFHIEGSYCSDFCVAEFCPCCASLQMAHELRAQNVLT